MKNEMIGEVLRSFRQKNNYSIKDVQKLLKKRFISVADKTIYSWEIGYSQPDIDTLFVLCDIYNISNILTTFGYNCKDDFSLSYDEKSLIEKYRNHPEFHDVINKLLEK